MVAFFVLACLFGWLPYELAFFGIGSNPENLPLGPVFAALVVATCCGGASLREWGRRLRHWRIHPAWYALALLAPVAIHVVDTFINHALGAPLPTGGQLSDWPQVLAMFVVFMVLVGLGEEGGWTAFAAPTLLQRYSFALTFALLAAMRIAWHLPLMLNGDLSWTVGLLGNAAFQFIVLAMFRASNGGWTLAAVWHSALNALGGSFLFTMVTGDDLARLGYILAVVYGLVAVGVAVTIATRSRRDVPPPQATPVEPSRETSPAGDMR